MLGRGEEKERVRVWPWAASNLVFCGGDGVFVG